MGGDQARRVVARRVVARLAVWIEPDDDPSAAIYGTIIGGALLAVESARRESSVEAAGAVLVTLFLFYLAHAYSAALEARLQAGRRQTLAELVGVARHEAGLIKGALVPLVVLLLARAASGSAHTAVLAALTASAVLLVLLELIAGLRSRLSGRELVAQVVVGAVLGVGVLVVQTLAH